MLHQFLTSNCDEVIARCRAKTASRFVPSAIPAAVDHGVPLFLQQLVDILYAEKLTAVREVAGQETAASTAISRAAALHGTELLRLGFNVDQVIRGYGDICQSVTELAVEQNAQIPADEFRTLNRCLDDAIADAVTSFGQSHQLLLDGHAKTLHERLKIFSAEQKRLVDIALNAYAAIRTGNIGLSGATGTLLIHALTELRALAERTSPEIQVPSADTTLAPG